MSLPKEVPCAASSSLNTDLSTAPMEIDDEGLSLAQRRSRCVGVPMPLRYRQYEDVLPQPPPSVPSCHTATPPNPLADPTDVSTGTRIPLWAPPFRTARNPFGLVRQFFSSTPPSHNPEEVVTLQDISSVPAVAPAEPDPSCAPHDLAFHLYPNQSSFKLSH